MFFVALLVSALLTSVSPLGEAPAGAAVTGTWSFAFTGAPQLFTVPAGVTSLTMLVTGGPGGRPNSNVGQAGQAGLVLASFTVTPGSVLTVWVGRNGGSEGGWGFGCGGRRGPGGTLAFDGGGGGGASAVTTGSWPMVPLDCVAPRPDPSTVLVVAGAGGGGGGGMTGLPPPPGGTGGTGGNPAGGGGNGTNDQKVSTPGGCGGCETSHNGNSGEGNSSLTAGGGGGGGGGGMRAGDGGTACCNFPEATSGGGGGGGTSTVGAGAQNVHYLGGNSGGDGSVVLTTFDDDVFSCNNQQRKIPVTVPAGVGGVRVLATGGGGGNLFTDAGSPGFAGFANATVGVGPGDALDVYPACAGHAHGGWGYGTGGTHGVAPDFDAKDGAGGGGSSAVVFPDGTLIEAGGGGGGGGKGDVSGGGAGGWGGAPAGGGQSGLGDDPGSGGCGGCKGGPSGHHGHASDTGTGGGGGGGGGAGYFSGAGGTGGGDTGQPSGAGGGGGGGGLSAVTNKAAVDVELGTSENLGEGLVVLMWLPAGPGIVEVYGGSGQDTYAGQPFAEPLAARVTDLAGRPLGGVPVTFTLTGSSTDPSGTFAGGATTQVVVSGSDGVATTATITANRNVGTWNATAAVSGALVNATYTLGNLPGGTATSLQAAPNPAYATEAVTLTATVVNSVPDPAPPTGLVTFNAPGSGEIEADLVNGVATFTIPASLNPGAGSYTASVSYPGDSDHGPSSAQTTLTIVDTPTAITVTSAPNPSDVGEGVLFSGRVTALAGQPQPTGCCVEIFADADDLGGAQVEADGTWVLQPPFDGLALGTHQITATWPAENGYAASSGAMTQTVDPDGTATTVTSSANPVEYGVAFDLAAMVAGRPPPPPAGPTGTVAFTSGATALCTGTVSAGATSCTPTTFLDPGAHLITGAYSGDTNFHASSGTMTQRIVPARTTASIEVGPTNFSVYGLPIELRARVQRATSGAGTPTGTIQFSLDGTPVGAPVPLGPTGATTSIPLVTAGAHNITAAYSGDARFTASDAATTHLVVPGPTQLALHANREPSDLGKPVTFTALVTASNGKVPQGSVQFRIDGINFDAPVPIANGTAVSLPNSTLLAGDHDVRAIYIPTGDFVATSGAMVHGVNQPTTTFAATEEDPAPPDTALTFAAHVAPIGPVVAASVATPTAGARVAIAAADPIADPPAAATAVPTAGTVSFELDGAPISACQALPLTDSGARCTIAGLADGTYTVLASYSGAPLFDPSQGTAVQVVGRDIPPPPPAPPRPPQPHHGGANHGNDVHSNDVLPFTGLRSLWPLGVLLVACGTALSVSAWRPRRMRRGSARHG